jgi:hypothetical protein
LAAANGTSAKRGAGPSQFSIASWRSGALAGLRAASRANSEPPSLPVATRVRSCSHAIASTRALDTFSITSCPPRRSSSRNHCALCRRRSIANGETAKRPLKRRNGLATSEQIVTRRPSILGASAWPCSSPSSRS